MNRLMGPVLAAAVGIMRFATAGAETVVEDVTVTAEIETACTVMDDVLDFGRYEPLSGEARTSTARVTLSCPEGARISVRLDGGEHLAGGDGRIAG